MDHPCIQVNNSECNSLELTVSGSGHIVKGYAVFDGPTLTGRIMFVSCIASVVKARVGSIIGHMFATHVVYDVQFLTV